MHSHSFQDTDLRLHRTVNDSPWQVVEGLTIPPFPRMGQKWRINHSKNVNSMCFRTVFKIQSSNITGTSMTLRDRSWMGWRFHRTPRWVRNKKGNHSKNVNSTCIRTVFKLRSSNFTGTSMILRHRSWRGWRFHRTPRWDINRGLITRKNVKSMCIRTVFKIQSQNFTGTSMTLRERSWRGWQFHRTPIWVRNKVSITQKNVNSTCIRTVFQLRSSNFTGTSMTLRDRSGRGWRSHPTPRWVRKKGLITQKTLIRRAFAQLSSYEVQTSQERQWLSGTGRGGVDDSIPPPDGSEKKG